MQIHWSHCIAWMGSLYSPSTVWGPSQTNTHTYTQATDQSTLPPARVQNTHRRKQIEMRAAETMCTPTTREIFRVVRPKTSRGVARFFVCCGWYCAPPHWCTVYSVDRRPHDMRFIIILHIGQWTNESARDYTHQKMMGLRCLGRGNAVNFFIYIMTITEWLGSFIAITVI